VGAGPAKAVPIYQQNGLTPELIQEGRLNLLKHFRQKGFFDVMVDTQLRYRMMADRPSCTRS